MAQQLRIEFPGLFTTSAQEAMNAKPYLKVESLVGIKLQLDFVPQETRARVFQKPGIFFDRYNANWIYLLPVNGVGDAPHICSLQY